MASILLAMASTEHSVLAPLQNKLRLIVSSCGRYVRYVPLPVQLLPVLSSMVDPQAGKHESSPDRRWPMYQAIANGRCVANVASVRSLKVGHSRPK